MDALELLPDFIAVVEASSISEAARALGTPRASLSRRLAHLEGVVGVRLIHRSTRRLVLTRAGEELYRRARLVVRDAGEALDAVRRHDDRPRGLLRVSVPPVLGDAVTGGLSAFLRAWPEVELEVLATTRHVDLVGERFDCALRAGTVYDGALVARKLWDAELLAVASPAYLQRGAPADVDALTSHDLLLGYTAGEVPERAWPLRDGGRVALRGRLVTNDLNVRVHAALDGLGVALLPLALVEEAIAEGRLVPVLRDVVGARSSLSLVYPERNWLDPKVRAFIDHMAAWFTERPIVPPL